MPPGTSAGGVSPGSGRRSLSGRTCPSLSKDTLWDKLAPLGDEAATQILGMIDLNGDGVIDFNEFVFAWKDNPPFKSQMEKDSSRPEDDEDVP